MLGKTLNVSLYDGAKFIEYNMNIQKVLEDILEKHSNEIEKLSGQDVISFVIDRIPKPVLTVKWNQIDPIINFVAMDKDGGWRGYKTKPFINELHSCWVSDNISSYMDIFPSLIVATPSFNWRDLSWKTTLYSRPV